MIPGQDEADLNKPEEHLLWALRNMPTLAGAGMVTHPGFLRLWSKHLYECGFRHVDFIKSLADENGMVHVDKLPPQQIKFQKAFRGPRNLYNNAASWVPMDAVPPKLVQLPDIRQLTREENEAMLQQYRDAGLIPAEPVRQDMAQVIL
jgi:hypothetical protein